jgi:Ser-tRNA(Ala) deacylase AlaX
MTTLRYLENTYTFEAAATVTDVRVLEDGRTAVLLDETIFYPQGGGQPCDIGTISTGTSVFRVTDVRMDKDGDVLHIGSCEKGKLEPGNTVTLAIDRDRRIKNAKAHSAGHLIDCAMSQLGVQLTPTKGYHFPEGPNVEYEGAIDNSPEMVQKLQAAVDTLVAKNSKVLANELSAEEAARQGVFAPAGKKVRMVHFEGFSACGCGGTHVRDAGEIGTIVIRKIKTKGGITKVSYEVV